MTETVTYEIYDYFTGKTKFIESRKKARIYFENGCIVVELRIQEIRDANGDAVTVFSKRRWKQ